MPGSAEAGREHRVPDVRHDDLERFAMDAFGGQTLLRIVFRDPFFLAGIHHPRQTPTP